MVFAHQGPEFRFVVKDEVLTAYLFDLSVVARDGDVSHADLAVMAAAQLDALGGHVLDDHHVVGLLRDAFEDYVVAFGLLDGE